MLLESLVEVTQVLHYPMLRLNFEIDLDIWQTEDLLFKPVSQMHQVVITDTSLDRALCYFLLCVDVLMRQKLKGRVYHGQEVVVHYGVHVER